MKKIILFIIIVSAVSSCRKNENIFKLTENQSMLMYGKGQGQDAAINPYGNQDCEAVVRNLSRTEFSVRIKSTSGEREIITMKPKEKRVFQLPKGCQIYFDSESSAKVYLKFQKKSSFK